VRILHCSGNIKSPRTWGFVSRAEFFNIFNHPNFGNPTNLLTSPLFGQLDADARETVWDPVAPMAVSVLSIRSAGRVRSSSPSSFNSSSTATLGCVRS